MLRQKAMSDRVNRFDENQQAEIVRTRREVRYYKEQAVFRSTAVSSEENRGSNKNREGNNGSSSRGKSPREPGKKCNRK